MNTNNDISIFDVIKHYKGLDHQKEALNYLWDNISKRTMDKFTRIWRSNSSTDNIQIDNKIIILNNNNNNNNKNNTNNTNNNSNNSNNNTIYSKDIIDAIIMSVPNDGNRRVNASTAIPLLIKWCKHYNINNPAHIGYIIGTVSYESAFLPRKEIRASPTKQPRLYEIQNRYWNTGYYGRGYIQITWIDNYIKLGRRIGLGNRLVDNPDLALDPDISAHICVVGMNEGLFSVDTRYPDPKPRAKLSLYDKEDGSFDYLNARRIVNLMDNAELIASYGKYYEAVIKSSLYKINN